MINRKKKLRIMQFFLLSLSLIILYFSYANHFKLKKSIISKEVQKKLNQQILNEKNDSDIFYNISFNGLDLSGNRYILNAEEATTDKEKPEKIYMKKSMQFF